MVRCMLESVMKVFQRLILWKFGVIDEEEFSRPNLNSDESVVWLVRRFADKFGLQIINLAGDLYNFNHIEDPDFREQCVKFNNYFMRHDRSES